MTLPSQSEIKALHRKYAPSDAVFDIVYGHCRIVREIARQLLAARPQPVNLELVEAGCLLHDLGGYHFYRPDGSADEVNYVGHGPVGAALLKNEGIAPELCNIAAHHTGVGITKAEILEHHLPFPPADYLAQTIEERLVMYADKFHSKGGGHSSSHFNSFESYSRHVSQFGTAKVVAFEKLQAEFGEPHLRPLAARHHQPIT